MKLSLLSIVNAKTTLEKLAGLSLPIKVAYRVSKILNKVGSEFKDFEDSRIKLIRKYGTEQEDGNIEVLDENKTKFFDEMNELLGEDIILDIPLLDLDAFPDSCELSPAEMSVLELFFSEPK